MITIAGLTVSGILSLPTAVLSPSAAEMTGPTILSIQELSMYNSWELQLQDQRLESSVLLIMQVECKLTQNKIKYSHKDKEKQ